MSFERVHRSRSQTPQTSWSTSQVAPRPFAVQEPKRPPTQEEIENEAFQQNKFEATGLQLKEKYGTITPVEQERLGVLQAKMDSFWAQRMERAKAQPNFLEILIRNAQSTQSTEPTAPAQPNPIQAKGDRTDDHQESLVEPQPSRTGLPHALKAGVENLSGCSLDNVRVHYNSPKPAQLQTLAYTQGSEIHVAPGQEKHLPHEAWHVVQQMQGRVKPTVQMKGAQINNDERLESEADLMGVKAHHIGSRLFAYDSANVELQDSRAMKPTLQKAQVVSDNVKKVTARMELGSIIQRVRVRDSASGEWHETDRMEAQEIIALALRFYQLHNMTELRKIQEAHSDLPISDPDLYNLAYGEPHPRTRARHPDSEGESDNEDMSMAFRSLRDDEDPLSGLRPPSGHDKSITASAHVTAGSRAKTKSRFISGSRSKKVAGAWASDNKKGRVVKFDIPPDSGYYDLTRPEHQKQVFPTGKGSSLNTAKASQEVLVPDEVPPFYIKSIYEAEKLSVKEYGKRKESGVDDKQELFRSRTQVKKGKKKTKPTPFALHEVYNREEASEDRLRLAREHWDETIANVVEQTNYQFRETVGFEDIEDMDVVEFLENITDNPYHLDYIENDEELDQYLEEIDQVYW